MQYNSLMKNAKEIEDGIFYAKKSKENIKKSCPFITDCDIYAVLTLHEVKEKLFNEILDGKEDNETTINMNGIEFEVLCFSNGDIDIIDSDRRECYYGYSKKYGFHKKYVIYEGTLCDPNMYYAVCGVIENEQLGTTFVAKTND